ncbi:MAG: ArsR family transcriptional regulator [Candidatus Lokiarchaeota archaeon]|nr:ArsR family transcriptional regulator [Candidatus Lokiarchaeota archaeon]
MHSEKKGPQKHSMFLKFENTINEIFKYEIRIKILLLLRLYSELNVTEISKLINRNKATVSRHLKKMKKIGVLTFREEKSKGKINPLYYSVRPEIVSYLKLMNNSEYNLSENSEEKHDKLKRSLFVIKTIYRLVEYAISLINPFINDLESKLDEENPPTKELEPYLIERKQLSIRHYILNIEDIDQFWKLYMEFAKKIEKISRKTTNDDENHLIFMDALLPLKKMLKNS